MGLGRGSEVEGETTECADAKDNEMFGTHLPAQEFGWCGNRTDGSWDSRLVRRKFLESEILVIPATYTVFFDCDAPVEVTAFM